MEDVEAGRKENVGEESTAANHKPLDSRTEDDIRDYRLRSKQEITSKINELEEAWDIERVLQLSATSAAIIGLGLGSRRRGWLVMPAVSLSLLAWHAARGWNPTVPLFQRFGLRSREELNKEITALRILRGDFKKAHNKGERPRAQRVIEAISEVPAEEPTPPTEQIM